MMKKIREFLYTRFRPEIGTVLKNGYNKATFLSDLQAGIIVALVSLPMAIAFGIASGVTPEQGIITAIIAGFFISCFGGSRVQIGGPTGAFIVILFGIVQQYGHSGLLVATLLAGVILVIMGLLRLGNIIKLIPYPIVVGFTSGIALTIFSSQIKDFFGFQSAPTASDFVSKWTDFIANCGSSSLGAIIVGAATILIIIYFPRITSKVPGSLIAILFTTSGIYILQHVYNVPLFDGVETIGDRFKINASLPDPVTPAMSLQTIQMLFPSAFTIAVLVAIESLMSLVVVDGITGHKHRSNTELIGQGLANIASPLFGGIPVTGAVARTITNIKNGGKTPIAGIINSVVLILILLFLGNLAMLIPMSCLAGVLFIVAYNMSEWRTFKVMLKGGKYDVAVLLTTFFLTLIFGLTTAIEIGLLIALLTFMKRVTESCNVKVIQDNIADSEDEETTDNNEDLTVAAGIAIYEIDGPFFFGIANKLDELEVNHTIKKPKVKIIRMRKVPFVDSTGAKNLHLILIKSKNEGVQLILSGITETVYSDLEKAGFVDALGEEFIFSHIAQAVEKANVIVNQNNDL